MTPPRLPSPAYRAAVARLVRMGYSAYNARRMALWVTGVKPGRPKARFVLDKQTNKVYN